MSNWAEWERCPPGEALREADPEIAELIGEEIARQNDGIELIASENFVSPAVMEAMGSPLTNKYAEGLPGKRYYGGCEVVDKVEQLAIDRAKQLFGADHANVQPHSGAQANAAVFLAFLKPGDTFLGMDLSQGGHLTHGSPVNFSGLLYKAVSYGLTDAGYVDMDAVRSQARAHSPKMIIAGYSAYPRVLDFAAFAEIAKEVGAIFMVDMAHFAGLSATGVYPSPVPHADVVTTTTHKTLRGPRGGVILCRAAHAEKVDKSVFPGLQGGPLMHIIAAKAVCFGEALTDGFKGYQQRVIENARVLGETLTAHGYDLVSGGTDTHLLLLDLRSHQLTGKVAEETLHRVGITVNKNAVPGDPQKPWVTSGVRVGTPALTTRGMGTDEMKRIGTWIAKVLDQPGDDGLVRDVAGEVRELAHGYPLFSWAALPHTGVRAG